MNAALWKRWLIAGLIVGAGLSPAARAANDNQDSRGLAQPPRETPQFKPGDVLTVAAQSTPLMRGDKIIASVPKGQQVVVVEVRDPWLGIYVSIGDQKKAGWMRTTAFIPAAGGDQPGYVTAGYDVKPEGSPQVTFATESQPVSPSQASAAYCVPAGAADHYFRAYDAGYYTRHETDPNLEAWEPWMYRR
jgi:hypothetical protein